MVIYVKNTRHSSLDTRNYTDLLTLSNVKKQFLFPYFLVLTLK